ncbi:hypothetical protein QI122_08055 [Staphylococcus saprophyticus]|nr:hypothetical protein [Staphylococcus saprophyticus]
MELVELMKQKVAQGDNQISVNSSELQRLEKLKDEGYLLKYENNGKNYDNTYDVVFYVKDKFKEL